MGSPLVVCLPPSIAVFCHKVHAKFGDEAWFLLVYFMYAGTFVKQNLFFRIF